MLLQVGVMCVSSQQLAAASAGQCCLFGCSAVLSLDQVNCCYSSPRHSFSFFLPRVLDVLPWAWAMPCSRRRAYSSGGLCGCLLRITGSCAWQAGTGGWRREG